MTTHILGNHAGRMTLFGEPLIVRYDEGDCDTICATEPNMKHLNTALFEAKMCDERLGEHDDFSFNGQIIKVPV